MLFIAFTVLLLVNAIHAGSAENTDQPQEVDVLRVIHDDVERIKKQFRLQVTRAESCIECYEELDCFDMCAGDLSHVRELPYRPEDISTKFTLYTRRGKEGVNLTYTDVKPAEKFLDAPRKVVFLVHGFNSDASSRWVTELRGNILETEDVILITVDWSRGCVPIAGYGRAAVNAQLVGRQIAVVLQKLIRISPKNVTPQRTHLIGHSLGAQMGRFFSEYFKKISGGLLIGRITALDAAAPLFEPYNICLNSSHATFIDAIHTSAGDDVLRGKLGVTVQVGHIDLYVNGGSTQPGCGLIDLSCSHSRAHDYYIESFKSSPSCLFRSYACVGGLVEYESGKCNKVPNSYNAIKFDGMHDMPGRGVGFVDTRSSSPFCK